MSLRKLVVGAAAAALLVVSGCSSKEAGSPTATPTGGGGTQSQQPPATSSSGGTGSGSGAPKVGNPLDAGKFVAQPCSALSAAQLQTLSLPAQGKPDTDSQVARTAGPSCSWFNNDSGSGVDVGFLTGNKNGLADTYRGHDQGSFKGYFEPTDVDGYPAVFNDIGDYRNDGTCNITVGISNSLTFRAAVQDTKAGPRSCDRAKQVASAVLTTVKGG